MKCISEVVFILQARMNSQRVPNKMLRPFGNSTLFEIAINKLLRSSILPKENQRFLGGFERRSSVVGIAVARSRIMGGIGEL